jgi:adhesin/invasin
MRFRHFVALLLPVTVLTSCGAEVAVVQTPGAISLVQGNLQSIQGGLELPNPIIVRLLDTEGKPIAKTAVGFSVVNGGGAVNPGSALTDENGEARTKWVLGATEVNQALQAKAPGLDPLNINAIALLPTDLIIAQGNNQTAKPSAGLPNAIVIRVVGPNNAPMKGIAVAFQVIVGGGLISPQSALTNALGEVTARWSLGAAAGGQTLAVSSGSLQPITLNAIAVP